MRATVANTIRFGCSAYHSIFPNRGAVLNHLFCVNGNGYEWIKGQLVDVCDRYKRSMPLYRLIQTKFDESRKQNAFSRQHERQWKRDRKKRLAAGDPKEVALDASLDKIIDEAITEARTKNKSKSEAEIKAQSDAAELTFKKLQADYRREKRNRYRIPRDVEKRILDTKYNHWYPMSDGYCKMDKFPDDIQPDWLAALIETCNLIIANPRPIDQHTHAKQVKQNNQMAHKVLEKAMAHLVEKTIGMPMALLDIKNLSKLTKWPL